MKNWKVSSKIYIFILVMAILGLTIGGLGIIGMYNIQSVSADLSSHDLAAAIAMGDIIDSFQKERVNLANMLIYIDDPSAVRDQIAKYNEAHTKGDAAVQEYLVATQMSPSAAFMEAGALLNPPDGEYYLVKAEIMRAAEEGDARGVREGLDIAAGYTERIENYLSETMESHVGSGDEKTAQNEAFFRNMIIADIAVVAVGLPFAIFLGWYVTGSISKPLGFMSQALELIGTRGDLNIPPDIAQSAQECASWDNEIGLCARSFGALIGRLTVVGETLMSIAGGDLTVELDFLSDEDVMGKSLTQMTENLNKMFGEVRLSTQQVSIGSKQIAEGSQSLAQGSTEQAASVQQLSDSMTEISDKTKENAQLADKAAVLAITIKDSAEKGNRQMDEMMTAVKDINDASQSISKVIKTIDDIAFQTNILALNAAVEAARAGQHGKGFAVVAEEVRNLASKSADAAKETGELIANSTEKAELGARIADDTAKSLTEIVSGINESSELIGDIAQSSDEQSAGIAQINQSIEQVAQVIQQTSATAEQSAAAAHEMNGQSDVLKDLVDQFKLKGAGGLPGSENLALPQATIDT